MYPSLAIAPLIFFAHLCSASSSGSYSSASGSYCQSANDCNANEYCDYSANACKPKNSNGGTCTMSEQCVGFCDSTVSKCIAKKNNDALCSSSDQCVSGYCEFSSPCSPGSCYSCTDQSSCDAQTGCNYDQGWATAAKPVQEVAKPRQHLRVLVQKTMDASRGIADSTCKLLFYATWLQRNSTLLSYTCTARESNGGTCTSSDGCVSGLCSIYLSKCAVKKTMMPMLVFRWMCFGLCKSVSNQ